jgi:molybdate-binding protein
MSCCDTLSEKYNQLNIDYVELMNKEFDLQIKIEQLQSELKDAEDLLEANEYEKCKKCGMWFDTEYPEECVGCEQ